MKKVLVVFFLFMVVFVTGVVLNTPSVQLTRWAKLPQGVEIQGIRGTLRQGSVDYLQIDTVLIQGVQYSLQASCLLTFSICYDLSTEDGELESSIDFNLVSQSLVIQDFRYRLDARFFESQAGLLVKPSGSFAILIEELIFEENKIHQASGQVNWINAGLAGDSTILGQYRADIELTEAGIVNLSSAPDSALSIAGQLMIERGGRYNADIQIEAASTLQQSIRNLLEASLKPVGLGQYRFQRKGQVRHPLLDLI